ncbi:MAG: magnesium transporter [Myxococcales bacterium]|nr:magnesium transporter [Myxococcales bacterium]
MLGTKQALLTESVQRLLRRGAAPKVQHLLEKTRTEDIAHIMSSLTVRERRQVFDLLKTTEAQAHVLAETERSYAGELLEPLALARVVEILKELESDDVADILRALPDDRSEPILQAMHAQESGSVEEILGYAPETAGSIMSADYFALNRDMTVQAAIATLQEIGEDVGLAFYVYIINEHGHLVGVISLRQLVTSRPEKRLSEVMEPDVVAVKTEADQEEVAGIVARYNWLAVPVVDENNKLRGIITVDDIIDVIKDEATEDILKLAGAGEELAPEAPASEHLRMRYPWLITSCISGFAASAILEPLIGSLGPFLGSFAPIVMGMAGNVGIQSSTVVVRGLATGQVDAGRSTAVIRREILVGLVLGAGYGSLVGVAVALWSWFGSHAANFGVIAFFGTSVGLALAGAMLIAATAGSVIPIVVSRFGVDPAVATGPFVTSSIDVIGLLSFFGIATALATLFGIT